MSRRWQSAEGLQGRSIQLFLSPESHLPGNTVRHFFPPPEDITGAEFTSLLANHRITEW